MVIAKQLEILLVTIGSDWLPEWVTSFNSDYTYAPAADFFLPSTAEYAALWSGDCCTVSECLDLFERNNMRLALVRHANSLIAKAEGYLRL